jgi:hypothetical protein
MAIGRQRIAEGREVASSFDECQRQLAVLVLHDCGTIAGQCTCVQAQVHRLCTLMRYNRPYYIIIIGAHAGALHQCCTLLNLLDRRRDGKTVNPGTAVRLDRDSTQGQGSSLPLAGFVCPPIRNRSPLSLTRHPLSGSQSWSCWSSERGWRW